MKKLELRVKKRLVRGRDNKKLRKDDIIPVIIYGRDIKSQEVQVKYMDFKKVFEEAGESSLLDLVVDGQNPLKVIIQDVQLDPKTDRFIHVDFHQVKMTEKITAEIVLKFVGESRAVKELGGVLIKNLDKVRAECLPGDLVHEIEVDLSPLNTFEDIIYIRDIKVPEKIKLLEKRDEVVAKVIPPRTEDELKSLDEEAAEEKIEEVEVEEKGKKDEIQEEMKAEEGEEGKKEETKKDEARKNE